MGSPTFTYTNVQSTVHTSLLKEALRLCLLSGTLTPAAITPFQPCFFFNDRRRFFYVDDNEGRSQAGLTGQRF